MEEKGEKIDGVPIWCAYTDIVPVSEVRPNPDNPNRHPDKQIELLGHVISNQGWRAPITVSLRSGLVVRGHGRLEAAKRRGFSRVPIDRQHYDSSAAEMADLLADNQLPELSSMDKDKLSANLMKLEKLDIDMKLTGFDKAEIKKLMAGPGTPAPGPGGRDEVKEVFAVYVACTNEAEQLKLLARFEEEGLECRALIS